MAFCSRLSAIVQIIHLQALIVVSYVHLSGNKRKQEAVQEVNLKDRTGMAGLNLPRSFHPGLSARLPEIPTSDQIALVGKKMTSNLTEHLVKGGLGSGYF